MTHSAKIICDSISPNRVRITTLEITIPRIVLAEFNTHRVFSRNSASSRAIPVKKMLQMVDENPYIPTQWGKNKSGMQAGEPVSQELEFAAIEEWIAARDSAVKHAKELLNLGIHKQLTNRLIEPFMWHTIICTSTEWGNFDNLRDNEMAHPDIHIGAALIKQARAGSVPRELEYGQWHCPLVTGVEFDDLPRPYDPIWYDWVRISSARCARVSYLTHDGKRDLNADRTLYDRLLQPGHMSPFEHPARPMEPGDVRRGVIRKDDTRPTNVFQPTVSWSGNYRGWVQHRKLIKGEADILEYRKTHPVWEW